MFGTAVPDFTKYPSLFNLPIMYIVILELYFLLLKNKNQEFIEEKCIGTWAHLHGLVGLLRKGLK